MTHLLIYIVIAAIVLFALFELYMHNTHKNKIAAAATLAKDAKNDVAALKTEVNDIKAKLP